MQYVNDVSMIFIFHQSFRSTFFRRHVVTYLLWTSPCRFSHSVATVRTRWEYGFRQTSFRRTI